MVSGPYQPGKPGAAVFEYVGNAQDHGLTMRLPDGAPAAMSDAICCTNHMRDRKPPRCPECSGLLKPATISFGQSLRQQDLEAAARAAENADLAISLGSTLSVTPAAHVPLAAAQRGIPYAIVNRGPTEHDGLSQVTLRLDGDVNAIFPPAVAAALENA